MLMANIGLKFIVYRNDHSFNRLRTSRVYILYIIAVPPKKFILLGLRKKKSQRRSAVKPLQLHWTKGFIPAKASLHRWHDNTQTETQNKNTLKGCFFPTEKSLNKSVEKVFGKDSIQLLVHIDNAAMSLNWCFTPKKSFNNVDVLLKKTHTHTHTHILKALRLSPDFLGHTPPHPSLAKDSEKCDLQNQLVDMFVRFLSQGKGPIGEFSTYPTAFLLGLRYYRYLKILVGKLYT